MENPQKQTEVKDLLLLLPQTLEQLKLDSSNEEWRKQLTELRTKVVPEGQRFPAMVNDTFLRVFRREPIEHLPIWIMRQAGRYLPEFLNVRKKFSFFEVCDNPILSAEITLQPINRFRLDCAIIFSDILVIPKALGLEVTMQEQKGPVLPKPLSTPEDLQRVIIPKNLEDTVLRHVFDALFLTRQALEGKVSLIGFAGAPWTIFTYMIEGGGSQTFSKSKKWIYLWKEQSLKLLKIISDLTGAYLVKQIEAGAQAVQIFDSWSGQIVGDDYREFALQPCIQIAQTVKAQFPNTPVILFPKGQNEGLQMVFGVKQFDAVSIDNTVSSQRMRKLSQDFNQVVQGHLDPGLILAAPETIEARTQQMIDSIGTERYVVNLGHGLWPEHNPQHVQVFIETTRNYSEKVIAESQKSN